MKTFSIGNCQPPCEAVSWNIMAYVCFVGDRCQPPCEAVSWNVLTIVALSDESSSASLWGCELKCFEFLFSLGEIPVSLLVRLWVEIHQRSGSGKAQQGQPPCEAVSWNACSLVIVITSVQSASLWGCELKCVINQKETLVFRQPPCEAVSWNAPYHCKHILLLCQPPCEAVSWNFFLPCSQPPFWCQPPCEAVSWNFTWVPFSCIYFCQPPCEAVSWNSEAHIRPEIQGRQPPCEAVSWNITRSAALLRSESQPPCEAVSWNKFFLNTIKNKPVSLLVRLWVEMTLWNIRSEESPVSLLVRLWVEIAERKRLSQLTHRQPPCEAVSWNVKKSVANWIQYCQPPCEAVSWNG